MSLLMEALKKAEQAKREASASPPAPEGVAANVLSLAQNPPPAHDESRAPALPESSLNAACEIERLGEGPVQPMARTESPSPALSSAEAARLSLLPCEERGAEPACGAAEAVTEPTLDDEREQLRLEAALMEMKRSSPTGRTEERPAPPPAAAGAEQAVPRAPAPPKPPVEGPAAKAARSVPLPRAGRPRGRAPWVAIAVALSLVIVAGGYYVMHALQSLSGNAPVLAPPAGVEHAPDEGGAIDTAQDAAPAPQPSVAEARAARQAPAPKVAAPSRPVLPPVQAEAARVEPPLQIERTVREDPLERRLQSAYAAYQRGDLATARHDYEQARQLAPDNRDVLLGLAVVAQRSGDYPAASAHYRRLLAFDPKDSVARTGLMGLQQDMVTHASESQLKLMLQEEPEGAHLHFALGAYYAAQAQWTAAQQAFFQAHRRAPENADYMFNLAVSLDRLGQARTALEYYRRAEQAASQQPVSFDTAVLAQRIAALAAQERP